MYEVRVTPPGKKSGKVFMLNTNQLTELINKACEEDLHLLLTDASNDAEDIMFMNAPCLQMRVIPIADESLWGPWDVISTPHTHINKERANSEFAKVSALFAGYGGSPVAPAVVDDWNTYSDWMQHILK